MLLAYHNHSEIAAMLHNGSYQLMVIIVFASLFMGQLETGREVNPTPTSSCLVSRRSNCTLCNTHKAKGLPGALEDAEPSKLMLLSAPITVIYGLMFR